MAGTLGAINLRRPRSGSDAARPVQSEGRSYCLIPPFAFAYG